MKKISSLVLIIALAGCASHKSHTHHDHSESKKPLKAKMLSKSGYKNLEGAVRVFQENGHLYLSGEFSGLKPNTVHGFHIHENGDCSSKDAKSAGGHFNPESDHKHGAYKPSKSHAGDLGNIKTNALGRASVKRKLSGLNTLQNDSKSVLNKSVVIHAKADDFKSQPSGDSGKRIGCGVLKLEKNITEKSLD